MNNKIALIADSHFGIKKSNDNFLQSQLRFFKDEFVPYLKKNDIKHIFWLGDIFDNRNHLNVKLKNYVYDLFEDDLKDFKITMLVGNHDTYFNSSTDIHALKWFKKFDNIEVIEDITEVTVYNKRILVVPWQVNNANFMKRLNEMDVKAKICMGHFDFAGFYLNKFKLNESGLVANNFFDKFNFVFSGHFHTRNKQKQSKSEIVYIGSPYQLTRNDIGEERGCMILDLKTNKYEYLNNSTSIKFVQLNYPEETTKENIEGNIVDINIVYDKKYNEDDIQRYIKHVESFGPVVPPNVKITNDISLDADMKNYSLKSTGELMREYIDALTDIENKDEIYEILQKLHDEAKVEL